MAQLFNTPGDSLEGLALSHFEDIQKAVERGTNDMLIRPDWEANLQCCDLVNATLDTRIIIEVVFLLRRRLGSIATLLNPVSPKQVYLTLSLVEALVKNCGQRLHNAINDESFMEEMKRVAIRYDNKDGYENAQVLETALDIVQAWGEGFLTKRRQFPNIVAAYHDLKKHGLRFKEQYDASRVPIFTPAGETGNGSGPGEVHISDNTDMILAAAMQAEDARGGRPVITNGRVSDSVSRQQQQTQDSRGHGHSEGEGDLPRIADAVQTSVAILVSMMQELGPRGVANDDVALELKQQIVAQQQHLATEIEGRIMSGEESDAVAQMFKINDDAQSLVDVYDGCRNDTLSKQELETTLAKISGSGSEMPSHSGGQEQTKSDNLSLQQPAQNDKNTQGIGDLLDMSPNSPARHSQTQPQQTQEDDWADFAAPSMTAANAKDQIAAQHAASKGTGDLFDLLSTPVEALESLSVTGVTGNSNLSPNTNTNTNMYTNSFAIEGTSVNVNAVQPLTPPSAGKQRRLSQVGQMVQQIESKEKGKSSNSDTNAAAAALSWLSKAGGSNGSSPSSSSTANSIDLLSISANASAVAYSNPFGAAPAPVQAPIPTYNTSDTFDLLGGFDDVPAVTSTSNNSNSGLPRIPMLKPPPQAKAAAQAELNEIDLMSAVPSPSSSGGFGGAKKKENEEEAANPFDLF